MRQILLKLIQAFGNGGTAAEDSGIRKHDSSQFMFGRQLAVEMSLDAHDDGSRADGEYFGSGGLATCPLLAEGR